MGFGKRILKGASFKIISLFLQVAVSFVMIPFIISTLGDKMYGVWVLVGTFLGYYGFLDFGISSSVERYISKVAGQGNAEEGNWYISTALCLFIILGCISFLIITSVSLSLPFFVDQENIVLYRQILTVIGISFAVGFPMRIFEGILNANLRHDLAALSNFVKTIIGSLALYLLLTYGYGILSLVIATAIVEFINQLSKMMWAYKIHHNLSIRPKYIKQAKAVELFHYSSKTFLSQVADFLRFQIDYFVITAYVGLASIAYWSIPVRLIDYFGQVILNLFGGLSSYYSFHDGNKDYDLIRKRFLSVTKLCIVVTTFIGTSMILYGEIFINRWMGPGFEQSTNIMLLLLVPAMVALMQNPSIGLMYGLSKHHYYAIMNICEGVLNLILSLILVRYYGVYGVVLGTVIEMMIFKLFIQPALVCKVIDINLFKVYYPLFFLTFLKIFLPITIFYYVIHNLLSETYTSILLAGSAQGILILPIIYFIILKPDERETLLNVLKKKVKKS